MAKSAKKTKSKQATGKKRASLDARVATILAAYGLGTDGTEGKGVFGPALQRRQEHSFVDLHLHSTASDGRLSPTELVRKAAANGVRIMALTDHDTMQGCEEAAAAGAALGVRVIPGVEVSASAIQPSNLLQGEVIHLLAFFPQGGPCHPATFQQALHRIRTGRLERARCMVDKLRALGKPIELARVMEIAGPGVAPGRPHIARALVEAGHCASEGDAFALYLKDQGPAYARGSEIPAVEAVELIRHCGGLSVLAHPWSIKNDLMGLVARLAAAGLDGMEVYSDAGKVSTYSPLADLHHLLRTGGSDFHGSGAADEREPGWIPLPVAAVEKILEAATPRWEEALRARVRAFAAGESSRLGDSGLAPRLREEAGADLEEACCTEDLLVERSSLGRSGQHDDEQAEGGGNPRQRVGPTFSFWTSQLSEGCRTLVTPLLLTKSERDAVSCEAQELNLKVESLTFQGHQYLALADEVQR